jgi:hypothetical protein
LALALGKTVRQLLAQISSEELTEWRAYSMLEPFGEQLADQRHGIAFAALANLHRDPRRQRQPYRPEDFIPWHFSHRSDRSHRSEPSQHAHIDERRGSNKSQNKSNADNGTLLVDPDAQSRLIKQLFQRDG